MAQYRRVEGVWAGWVRVDGYGVCVCVCVGGGGGGGGWVKEGMGKFWYASHA